MTVSRLMLVLFLGQRLFLRDAPAAQPAPTNTPAATTNHTAARPPKPATDLAKEIQVKRGFRIDLVASDPLVADPVAMAFDEIGRLFVVEARQGNSAGRVRVLEDTDGDGTFDTSSVLADNLDQPSAIICYGGGAFVACGSQILFLKDTDGDGVADVRRLTFTVYGDAEHGNQNVNITCLGWGLDNRIHVGTGISGRSVSANAPAKSSITLVDGNFAFDPRTFQLQAESGVAPTGLCFDDRGREFVCSSGDHIVEVMYEARYAARTPGLPMPGALLDIAAAGTATTIFPLRPTSTGAGPVRFSSAAGLTIYRGNAFPADYVGDAFVADTDAGIIHHEKLR
ncbi:MAG TPA: PVC-type heme-binding CxxCH protein, partial [Verrucomicrobiae bacterium]|nr:PVC-type heme-binding CxxCH protein [Verrucomicrobiae bacterium]